MLKRRRISAALATLLAALLAAAGPPPPHAPQEQATVKAEPLPQRVSPNPIQTVRVFAALQERIVNGSSEALQSRAELAREIGNRLLKFDATTWKDARNREAVIKFALMGGDPRVAQELEGKKVFEGIEATLAKGAIAFAYGDRKTAEAELGSVDPRSLPPGLGGYVALIVAVIVGPSDPLKAIGLCDEARLLSPGTAVEEAALRLSIELAIASNSASRFDLAVIHHLRRFPNSLYAQAIDSRIARVLAARKSKPSLDVKPWAAIVEDDLPVERRRNLLEEIVKAGLRGGATPTAAFAAGYLRELATENAQLLHLCRAAEAALAILDGRRAEARALLSELASADAAKEVRALIGELRGLVATIEAPPDKASAESPVHDSPGSNRRSNSAPRPFAQFDEVAKKVETVLGDADTFLRKAGS